MVSIEKTIKVSKKVIKDSSLENGAIVAANVTKNCFPPEANHYFYVWPRDASYICIAADIAGIKDIQKNFFNWCLKRAEGFLESGIFFETYYPNGPKKSGRFQPDQTGTLLFAIWHHYQSNLEKAPEFEDLIVKAANGLCDIWNKTHFKIVTNDLWEERLTFPDLKDNFTYSLAACIKGLECANEMISNEKWLSVSKQMKKQLDKHFVDGFFVRSYGKLIDNGIDSSILGLVYPFEIYRADDKRVISTVSEIEKRLVINGGVHRYELDRYDGWVYHTVFRNKGAGAWPLLNFWMSIYYSLKGDKGDKNSADRYYKWVLERIDGKYIPEQIFENDIQVSVSPLVWSHSMFIISSKFLGYI